MQIIIGVQQGDSWPSGQLGPAGDDLIRTKHRRIGNQIFEVKVLMEDVTYVEPIADLTMFR